MSENTEIIDIHTHLWPPEWGPNGKYEKKSFGFSPEIYRKIVSPKALVDEFAVDPVQGVGECGPLRVEVGGKQVAH